MWIFAITGVLSLAGIGHLWIKHHRDRTFKRLLWSLILLIPGLGLLLYGCLYHPPNAQATSMQCDETSSTYGAEL